MTDNREPKGETDEAAEQTEEPAVAEVQSALPGPEPDSDELRNAVGAYLLDALPDEERQAFESFLATSPETQEELRQLAPVVSFLPRLLELDTVDMENAPTPTSLLRERILSDAQAERAGPAESVDSVEPAEAVIAEEPREESAGAAVDTEVTAAGTTSRTIRTAPEGTGPFDHKRRTVRPRTSVTATRSASSPFTVISQIPAPWLVAAALSIVAIGAIIWALALQGRIDSKDREIAAQSERLTSQEAEIADLRQNANATAYQLSASDEAAANANGTLLFSPQEQIGVLYVRELPPLDDNRVYQLWYLDDQGDAPRPGGTFRVDRNGDGMIAVESDTPTFDGIALTEEPRGGSEAPTSDIVLHGRLGGAAG